MNCEITIRPVSPFDGQTLKMISLLDRFQIGLYGVEHCRHLDPPAVLAEDHVLVLGAFCNSTLIGMAAIKLMDGYAEIKRMYIDELFRGRSIAQQLMMRLELHAVLNGYTAIGLETGRLQHPALRFYKKMGYVEVPGFGPYTPDEVCIYMMKVLPER